MLNYFQIGPEVFDKKIFKVFPFIYIGKLDPPAGGYAFQWILIEITQDYLCQIIFKSDKKIFKVFTFGCCDNQNSAWN